MENKHISRITNKDKSGIQMRLFKTLLKMWIIKLLFRKINCYIDKNFFFRKINAKIIDKVALYPFV